MMAAVALIVGSMAVAPLQAGLLPHKQLVPTAAPA